MLRPVYRLIKKFFKNDDHWNNLGFFRGVSIFHGMTSRQLGRIMQAMQRRTYHAGEIMFQEGQPGKAVFIIESGKVELTRRNGHGEHRVLGQIGKGQVFGELALLDQTNRTATAQVIEDGVIHLLYTSTLDSLIRQNPAIGVRLLRNMAQMLSALLVRTNRENDRRKSPT